MGRHSRVVRATGVAVAVLLALTACADQGSPGGSAAAPSGSATGSTDGVGCDEARGKVVGFSEPLPDPNFAAIEKILSNALSRYGATLRATNANLDPGKQISDIRTLLQQQVDVLIANPRSEEHTSELQ